jgi:hypothetical protein
VVYSTMATVVMARRAVERNFCWIDIGYADRLIWWGVVVVDL